MISIKHWVIVGSVGGGVVATYIATPQGMTYEAASKLADEINAMYAVQQGADDTYIVDLDKPRGRNE